MEVRKMTGSVFLEDGGVALKTIEEEDLDFLSEIYNHPEVLPNLTWDKPRNLGKFKEKFDNEISESERIDLIIESDEERIGQILLLEKDEGVAEMGIWLHPDKQNQGFGTKACELIIDYAFSELRYNKIFNRVYEGNKASQRLWEKLGFKQEGTLRNQIYTDGEFKDAYLYGLLREEWREREYE
jgi:RimJ/RimL family protein N-acetyltransferase